MYSFSLIDSFSGSDTFFYILMVLLTLIAIALFYLIYTQKKEMAKKLREKSVFSSQVVEEKRTGSSIKEVESLVPELTPLVPVTDMEIPDPLELTRSINIINDTMELKNITKELKSMPKERKVNMTPYEAEQEEKAIISYEELLNQNNDVSVDSMENTLENEVVNKVLDNVVVSTSYTHEEKVLESLKALLNTLRG